MHEVVEPDVVSVIHDLQENPRPMCDALSRYPHTLVHGDYWFRNVGLQTEPCTKLIALDWQLATVTTPVIDLVWYIMSTVTPISRDQTVAYYRQALARRLGPQFDEEWWRPQRDLSLLTGFLRVGCWFSRRLLSPDIGPMRPYWQDSLDWWSERVQIGLKWL